MTSPWGLAGRGLCGTLLCVHHDPDLLERMREAIGVREGLFGVTQLEGVIVCRYLGDHAYEARQCFERAWTLMRPAFLQRAACAPRVWATLLGTNRR